MYLGGSKTWSCFPSPRVACTVYKPHSDDLHAYSRASPHALRLGSTSANCGEEIGDPNNNNNDIHAATYIFHLFTAN